MKALFLHDHKIYRQDHKLYSRGGLSRKIMERYLNWYDNLTLATRETKHGDPASLSQLSTGDIGFVAIPNLSVPKLFNYKTGYNRLTMEVRSHDIIIARLPSMIGLMGLYIANKQQKNIVVEVVGCPWDSLWNYGGVAGKVMAPIQWLLTKHYVKKASNVIYVTTEFLQKRYPTNALNSVDCSDVEIEVDSIILNKRLEKIEKNNPDMIRLGMIGNIEAKYKGFDTALKTLSILNDEYPDKYTLEIVGGGKSSYIKEIIKKYGLESSVKLVGVLEHPHGINQWLDAVDIFLQPSKVEGLPRALVEAMSRGCACVGSDIGGIPELLKGENIMYKNNPQQLANIILRMTDIEQMKLEAEYSFSKAKKFEVNYLTEKRNKFYLRAKEDSEIQK